MKPFYKKNVSVDDIQFYLTSQVTIIPELYDHFLDSLNAMERQGQVSLLPIAILQLYNKKIGTSCKAINQEFFAMG